jgi:hypothetical protein
MVTAAEASAVDWWALAFAIAATVAAVVAAMWGWVDRPQQTWWYSTVREPEWKPRDGGGGEVRRLPERHEVHAVKVTIRATGAAMLNASLYVDGCTVIGKLEERTPFVGELAPGTDPLRVEVLLPASPEPAYVGLVWIRRRPLAHFGARLNLRTDSPAQEVWRWDWRSLRIRSAGGRVRVVRTTGRWVPHVRALFADIPLPEAMRHR